MVQTSGHKASLGDHTPLRRPSLSPAHRSLLSLTLESAKTYSFRRVFSFSVSTKITSLFRNF